jgi:hypothetical protein
MMDIVKFGRGFAESLLADPRQPTSDRLLELVVEGCEMCHQLDPVAHLLLPHRIRPPHRIAQEQQDFRVRDELGGALGGQRVEEK